jgi:hypothetical protein
LKIGYDGVSYGEWNGNALKKRPPPMKGSHWCPAKVLGGPITGAKSVG